jgi:hypothetical protein
MPRKQANKDLHPSAVRLYEAAASLKPAVIGQSAVASWLIESPQTVNNWERRGVSRAGALAAQRKSGFDAHWILTGEGERRKASATAPEEGKKGDFIEALSTEERELVRHFRHLLGSDRKVKLAEIAALAKEREAQRRELFEEAGIDRIMQNAAHATRRRPAKTAIDPKDPRLKQQTLPYDEK